MRILVDLQACQNENQFRGIGRYSRAFVESLLVHGAGHEFHLLLNGAFRTSVPELRNHFGRWIPYKNFHVFFPIEPCQSAQPENSWRRVASQFIRQELINHVSPDYIILTSLFEGFHDSAIVCIPENSGVPVFSVLYDLIPLAMRQQYLADPVYSRFYLEQARQIANAAGLLCISQSTADEVTTLLGYPREKTIDVSAAMILQRSSPSSGLQDLSRLKMLGIEKKYVLYVPGGFDLRKNLKNLFLAWARLDPGLRSQYMLVLCSKVHDHGLIDGPARQARVPKSEYTVTGYVNDDELCSLYCQCEVFVFPSIHEGFGLPVLEAISFGAAVICSNTTSLPEVVGNSEALFDPTDPDEIASKLSQSLTDPDFRRSLKEAALKQAQRFSWKRVGQVAVDYLTEALEASVRGNPVETAPSFDLLEAVEAFRLFTARAGPRSPEDEVLASVAIAALEPAQRPPRLYVDLTQLTSHDARTGIQRVVRAIHSELPELLGTEFNIVSVWGHESGRYLATETDLVRRPTDKPIDPKVADIFLGLDLSAHLFPAMTPEIERFRVIGVKVFFLVYDIIPLTHPEFCDEGLVRVFREWTHAIAQHSDGLFCISRTVAEELRMWLGRNGKVPRDLRVEWFHLGADIAASKPSVGMPEDSSNFLVQLEQVPTYLMVGTLEPRKCHDFVLDAFELLWANNQAHQLVIVGKMGWKMSKLQARLLNHPDFGKRLFWLEGISDEYLEAIYSRVKALIAASVAEGFGLPIIEAAQKNVPVIARDIPVFREIGGSSVLYFSGPSPDSLADTILGAQEIPPQEITWTTWKQSAGRLTELIRNLV